MTAPAHSTGTHAVVAGLGKTGVSCVRHLLAHGAQVAATDSREQPPGLVELGDLSKRITLRLGRLDASLLVGASQLLLSPGISVREPISQAARTRGIEVLGDIELFARSVRAPVIGITGTNGKSTVTTLVKLMAEEDGRRVLAGGNLGEPALDLLREPRPDLYVLELSSFQLETTSSLALAAGVVLNVSPDHMDRYASLADYAAAKQRVFSHAAVAVLNLDDALVAQMRPRAARTLTFSLTNAAADAHVQSGGTDTAQLVLRGTNVMPASGLRLAGRHHVANALAALALGEAAGFSVTAMRRVLERFEGLPHRSQWIAEIAGVRYIDDSKGTNVGATVAAVAGLDGPLVLIAGGDGKQQDFAPLAQGIAGKVRHAVLIGRDAPALDAALRDHTSVHHARSMQSAVEAAARLARAGETVLLSPACSSLDMFKDYAERGDAFARAVRTLAAKP